MEDYEYEVFLSYKRGRIPEEWLDQTFLGLFEEHLTAALAGKQPRIFIDRNDIYPGTQWLDVVGRALATSKCMVAILSPSYFNSVWCKMEFDAMHNRQIALRKMNKLKTTDAVLTPLYNQGPTDFFPTYVDRIQLLDYSKYYRIGGAFRNSVEFLQLQDKIINDASRTGAMIRNAPPWLQQFGSQEWLTGPFDFLTGTDGPGFIQPKPSW